MTGQGQPRRLARKGSLSQAAPAVLIRAIYRGRKSGVLHLTRERVSKRLYFKEGSIILAGSDLDEDRTGQVLLRAGRITEADLELALRASEKTGKAIGAMIVEAGVLPAEEMQIEAAKRVTHIVESVMSWDSGDYSFEEREERLEGELLSHVGVPETLLEGIRGIRDAQAIRRLLGDVKGVPRRAETPPPLSDALSITPSEQWVLAQVNGVSAAEEIAAVCPLGEEEGLRAICGLLFAGVLELQRALAPSAAPSPNSAREDVNSLEPEDLVAALEAELTGKPASGEDAEGQAGLLHPRLPKKLGRYVVQEVIGRGSMGAVLLARDPEIDRPVAIKLIQTSVHLTPPEWEKYKERFYREARAAGRLLHPGIVTVFDVGHSPEGIPFIVMEYVKGRTLAELMRTELLELDEVLRLATQSLEALHFAHSHGIVHRDLKPANILVTPEGHPKIMDFGVAHVVGSEMTHADDILGTPQYMAPEQLGNGTVDQRTDLFALGVILYSMLTGKVPFAGDSIVAIAHAILSKPPVPPEQLEPAVPPALSRIVLRCLEKDAARRFSSAAELKEALISVRGATVPGARREKGPIPKPLRLETGPRRTRIVVGLALLLVLPVGLTLLLLRISRKTPQEREPSGSSAATTESRGTAELVKPTAAPAAKQAEGEAARPSETPATEPTEREAARPSEADLFYEAKLAEERGELESSEKMLRELLRRNPEFSGASELLQHVDDLKWRKKLPLVFKARHNHRIGGCTGELNLGALAIEYRSEEHGRWRWSFREIRVMERKDSWQLRIETREKDVLALGKAKSYNFSLLGSPLGDEEWAKYQRVAK